MDLGYFLVSVDDNFRHLCNHLKNVSSSMVSLVKLLIKRVPLVSMSTRITRIGTHEILCVFILIRVL